MAQILYWLAAIGWTHTVTSAAQESLCSLRIVGSFHTCLLYTSKDSINNPRCEYTITGLNQQLAFIQSKLVEYLSTIKEGEYKSEYQKAITDYFNPDDFSTEGRVRALDNMGLDFDRPYDKQYFQEEHEKLAPERIMLLSFNYTKTVQLYGGSNVVHLSLIHISRKRKTSPSSWRSA